MEERRHRTRVIHTIQLVKPCRIVDTNGLHHDFEEVRNDICASVGVRLIQDRLQDGARWSFDKILNENGANLRVGDADGFGELECDASAVGNDEDTQKIENQEKMSVTELELKSLPLRKTRAGRQEEKTSIETSETFWKDQGECRDGGSHQENTK